MRLLLGVHRSAGFPLTHLVDVATHARMEGPWLLGAPATHAFTVLATDGPAATEWWRFDAVAPCPQNPVGEARWTPWRIASTDTALWQIAVPEAQHGILCARSQTGRSYDLVQLAAQVSMLTAKLPGLPRADICTSLVAEQLASCGAYAEKVVAALPDLLPERIGRMLQLEERTGLTRRIDIGRLT